jgi:hypothetical protein
MHPPRQVAFQTLPDDRLCQDRRLSRRVEVFGCPARLGWWEGTEFRVAVALLKNVSRSGVAALAEASPPPGETAWLNLLGLSDEWVEATIIDVRKNRWMRRVPRLVRMHLSQTCPDDFYRMAIRGLHLASQPPSHPNSRKPGRPRRNHSPRP